MTDNDPRIEREIIRRQMITNDTIINSDGFILPIGSTVEVYNERGSMAKRRTMTKPFMYTVKGFHGGFYTLTDPTGKIALSARSKIKPV
jgi:hypothetical protein